jgi:predicted ATP-grasp superfamily ATP-dependent carboligase
LGKNGIKVFYVAEKRNEVVFSRYCHKFFQVPSVETSEKVLISFLSGIEGKIEGSVVLFPSSDLFCMNLAKAKPKLGDRCIFLTARSAIETLVRKRRFYASLDKSGVPHPLTRFPENCKDVEMIGKTLDYPLLVKPSISQLFLNLGKGLIVWSKEDLEARCKLLIKNNIEFVIQELIPGPPTNLFGLTGYLDRNHNPKGLFAYRRIREWPIGLGCNSLIESVPISSVQILKEITLGYLKRIGYTGIFEAEFKKDHRDGSFKILEINARSWWQNHFPTACGLNLVMMAYLDAIGAKIEYTEVYRTGVKWVFLYNDLFSSIQMLRRGQTSPLSWLFSYRNLRDWAYFDATDPLPWLTWPLLEGPIQFRMLLRKIEKKTSYNKIPQSMRTR